MGGAIWILVIGILVFLFAGDPNMHDLILKKLSEPSCTHEATNG